MHVENHRSAPFKNSKVLVCLELLRDNGSPSQWAQIVLSIPGREGTVTKTWHTPTGYLEHAQWVDMSIWIEETLHTAIMTTTGIQLSLPLG
jgi:hypothetical protein